MRSTKELTKFEEFSLTASKKEIEKCKFNSPKQIKKLEKSLGVSQYEEKPEPNEIFKDSQAMDDYVEDLVKKYL